MARSQLLLVLLASAVGITLAGKLPPSIKRCARTDSAVAECLRSAVEDALPKLKAGLPKLGVQPLDPLVIDRLELSQGQGPINMDLAFTDMHTSEILDGVKVKRAMFDLDKLTIEATTVTPRAVAVCNYTVTGRVLLLPINGAGKSKVVLTDITTNLIMKGKKITKSDGKVYLEITDVIAKLMPGKMEMTLENLFNGDKQLGATMNRVLNDNWQLVYSEVSDSFNQAYSELFKRPARALFLHVPMEDIFPEKL